MTPKPPSSSRVFHFSDSGRGGVWPDGMLQVGISKPGCRACLFYHLFAPGDTTSQEKPGHRSRVCRCSLARLCLFHLSSPIAPLGYPVPAYLTQVPLTLLWVPAYPHPPYQDYLPLNLFVNTNVYYWERVNVMTQNCSSQERISQQAVEEEETTTD